MRRPWRLIFAILSVCWITGRIRGSSEKGSLLYTLKVSLGHQHGVESLNIFAGDEPAREVLALCQRRRLSKNLCDELLLHVCTKTNLLCRTKKSVESSNQVVGFTRAAWIEDESECALAIKLFQNDGQRALEFTSDAGHSNEYIDALLGFHCANMARMQTSCYCRQDVRQAVAQSLLQELDHYRWSEHCDFYAKLGVNKTADVQQIRKAYRRLSFLFHPDRSSGDSAKATERIVALNEAYETLLDPIRRREYDRKAFGAQFVTDNHLHGFKAQVFNTFGRRASVSVDNHGNVKIVL